MRKTTLFNVNRLANVSRLARLSALAVALSAVPALADDVVFKGVLLVSRDITKPQVATKTAPAQAEKISSCLKSTTALPVVLPALADAAAVARYREQLKAEGVVAVESSLLALDRKAIASDVAPLLGQAIDNARVDQLKAIVLSALNKEGAMLADIYLPPQRSDDGYVVIVVSPAKVGKIVTNGQKYFDGQQIACEIRTQPGSQVNLKQLTEDLVWLNRTPWRVTDVSYAPGENVGEADITLTTTDRKPFRPYVSMDNTGTRLTGMGRYKVGVSWGNPFGLFDHRLDYSYTRSNVDGAVDIHALSYSMPVWDRTNLSFNFSRAEAKSQFNQDFSAKGTNTYASVGFNRVLPKMSVFPNLVHEGTLGFDYKHAETNLLFGQQTLNDYSSSPEVMQFYADYSAGVSDNAKKVNSYTHLGISPGLGFGNNTDKEFSAMRAGSKNTYWYVKETLDGNIKLPKNWGLRGVANMQYTPDVLPYSERLVLTGVNAVRGYHEDTLYADSGLALNLELQAPNIDLKLAGKDAQLQFFAFKDWGKGYSKSVDLNSDLKSNSKENVVSSLGIGARFSLSPFVQFNSAIAWADRENGRNEDYLAHLALVVGY